MTWCRLLFILLLVRLSANSFNFCSEVISNFPGYTCDYEEPEALSKQGSKTFLVHDENRKVHILKVYPFSMTANRELELLQRLAKQPSVVNLLEYKIQNKLLMMVLDFGHSMTLTHLVNNTSSLSDHFIFYKIARNLLQAIMRLNQEGISLTRIDPNDIIIQNEDFPIFTNLESAHDYNMQQPITGSPDLLAPELVDVYNSHKPFLPQQLGDVYSFGLLLYYMRYKSFPYPMSQTSTMSVLQQVVYFPVSEEKDFIDLVSLCLVVDSKRSGFDYVKEKLIEIQLNKREDYTRQRTKYQIKDGRLISFESENEKQKMVVISIGCFVFVLFLTSLIYIKCRKCLSKRKHQDESSLFTSNSISNAPFIHLQEHLDAASERENATFSYKRIYAEKI